MAFSGKFFSGDGKTDAPLARGRAMRAPTIWEKELAPIVKNPVSVETAAVPPFQQKISSLP